MEIGTLAIRAMRTPLTACCGSTDICILGAKLSSLSGGELLKVMKHAIESGRRVLIASGNAFSFNLAYEQPWYRQFLNNADYVRIDGDGLRLAARILGHRVPRRSTWADFGWDVGAFCSAHGYRAFLLGGRPGVADAAAARLQDRYPDLQIAGTAHGYLPLGQGAAEEDALIARINASGAHLLIVGLGMPLQERWLTAAQSRLQVPVLMTAGGVFDFVSGRVPRAPRLLRDHGFEWLYRLCIEPRRLWRRYLIGNPVFLARVLRQRMHSRQCAASSFCPQSSGARTGSGA